MSDDEAKKKLIRELGDKLHNDLMKSISEYTSNCINNNCFSADSKAMALLEVHNLYLTLIMASNNINKLAAYELLINICQLGVKHLEEEGNAKEK